MSHEDIQEADGETRLEPRGPMCQPNNALNRNYRCFIQQIPYCAPTMGWHCCSECSQEQKDSPSPASFQEPAGTGGHVDKGRHRESLSDQEISPDHPPAEPPRRPGAQAPPWGQRPAAASTQGGGGRQARVPSERCPICWNPLSTLTDPLSALGKISKLHCLSQRQRGRIAGDQLMFPTCFKTLLGAGTIWRRS